MKTQEELNILKDEVESLSAKLNELSEDELAQVSGGCVGRLAWVCFHKDCRSYYSEFPEAGACPDCGSPLVCTLITARND